MWPMVSTVVKMKRSMIFVRDDDLSNFKICVGGATGSNQVFEPRHGGSGRGAVLCPCVALTAARL